MCFKPSKASLLSIKTGASLRLALVMTNASIFSISKKCKGLYGSKMPRFLFSDNSLYASLFFFAHSTMGLCVDVNSFSSSTESWTNSLAVSISLTMTASGFVSRCLRFRKRRIAFGSRASQAK